MCSFKETFSQHNPPKMHSPTLNSLFKRRGRSSYPAGSSSFRDHLARLRNEAYILICAEDRASSNVLLAASMWRNSIKASALNTPCRFKPAPVYRCKKTAANISCLRNASHKKKSFLLEQNHSAFEQNGETDLFKLARICFRKSFLRVLIRINLVYFHIFWNCIILSRFLKNF